MANNPNRGHKIRIIKVFETKESIDKKGATKSFTPFTWCLQFQGVPILHFAGWAVLNGRIIGPSYKMGRSYRPYINMNERMIHRLHDALSAVAGHLLNPYRPAAVEWIQDPWFEGRCEGVAATPSPDVTEEEADT